MYHLKPFNDIQHCRVVDSKNNLPSSIRRGGFILFRSNPDDIYFCFGVDSRTKELTDFGGTILPNENPISGCIREFEEETCGVFVSKLFPNDIMNDYIFYNKSMAIIFHYYPYDITKPMKDFDDRISSNPNLFYEVDKIVWVPFRSLKLLMFKKSFRSYRLYFKVEMFLFHAFYDIWNVFCNSFSQTISYSWLNHQLEFPPLQ